MTRFLRALVGSPLVLPLVLLPGIALAAWSAGGSGAASSRANNMPAGNTPSVSVSGSSVTVSWASSLLPGTSTAVTGYQVRRFSTSTGTEASVGAGCSGTVSALTCLETGVSAGSWQYTITPKQGGWTGAQSGKSSAAVVASAVPPSSTIAFPASGSVYNDGGWNAGCSTAGVGDFCGTATDNSGAGLQKVRVSIQQGSGSYWNGSAFASSTEVLFDATGTTTWSYNFAAANFASEGLYTLRTRAVDNSGSTQSTATSTTFRIDRTAPTTTDNTATIGSAWRSTDATVTLTASDATGSGVSTTYYTTDGSTPTTSSPQGTSIALTANGTYTVKYFSVDAAGNTETVKTAGTQIRIDKTAPTAGITYPTNGASFTTETQWNAGCGTPSVGDICGTAGDATSGVASVELSIKRTSSPIRCWDGGSFNDQCGSGENFLNIGSGTAWTYAFSGLNFPNGNSADTYTVTVRVKDNAGNTTTQTVQFSAKR